MKSGAEGFRERIRLRSELAKTAIVQTINESALRRERQQQHPLQNVIDETLGSLRFLLQETEFAIQRVESLIGEWEHHGQNELDVVFSARPAEDRGAESVRPFDDSGTDDQAGGISGS